MLKGKGTLLRHHATSRRAPVRRSLNRAMARLSMALTGKRPSLDNDTIRVAVARWCDPAEDRDAVVHEFGEIEDWVVSQVTDMSNLFRDNEDFNDDISGWDVCSVIDMTHMFDGATTFNRDLSEWDMHNVTDMRYMFYKAAVFMYPMEGWHIDAQAYLINMFLDSSVGRDQLPAWYRYHDYPPDGPDFFDE